MDRASMTYGMADIRRRSLATELGKEGKSIDKNSYPNSKIAVLTSGGDAQGNVNIAPCPGPVTSALGLAVVVHTSGTQCDAL